MTSENNHFSNHQLAEIFTRIGDLLEIKGEVIYKILAYRKAADNLAGLGRPAEDYWRTGVLKTIPGVGEAIAEKIDELFRTGRLAFLEKLEGEVPPTLVELLQVPDVGPKKVRLFWQQLGVTTLAELDAAARQGRLRGLPGLGEKSEARILAGIEAVSRRTTRIPIGRAWPFAQELLAMLRAIPGVTAAEAAGSLRRMRETVGDLDLAVAVSDSQPVMDAFLARPDVLHVTGRGETKASVEFTNHIRAQLWAHPPERFGTALLYATGSKDHNVRLREMAQKRGLSLSDQSFLRSDGSELLCASEEEVYAALGLPWIAPELREDRGEIEAALQGRLPQPVQPDQVLAELHAHTTWSDGRLTVLELAHQARQRGRKLLAITDHSASLGVAGGLSPQDILAQRREIDAAQAEVGDSIRLLQGSEVEILADGALDFPDEILAQLDIVIASLHTALRQPRQQVTQRLLAAIRNPHVDIIAHPTGRLLPNREGADLDMEAVFAAAAETGTVLEINANPARLDLDDAHARRAVELGIRLSIDTDAHSASDLDLLSFGLSVARRGWVEPGSVINTWQPDRLTAWLKSRG
ncbi:MAG: DNA polymerase/3'-5' exonuclease PolX [Chloroflexota bacterium]